MIPLLVAFLHGDQICSDGYHRVKEVKCQTTFFFFQLTFDNREVLHSVRRNLLDGMLRSGCEFRKLIPKRWLKRSIETESERNSVDHFRKSHSLVQ